MVSKRKMDKAIREQHEQKINYLLSKRKHIEETSGNRVHPDLKLAYSWISDEIKHLKTEKYMSKITYSMSKN